jgi:signal transduction histidine kinase
LETILVVEDEISLRENIQETLELNNYRILTAGNGAEAIKMCKNEVPDLVLSDIMMPVMDGYKMLEEFQKDPRTSSVPFIFLTAKSGESDLRKGMNNGADDYVIKPFKIRDLLQAVSTRLGKKKKTEKVINQTAENISRFVPHELRTPLVTIMGFTQLLIDENGSLTQEETNDYLSKIKTASSRLHKTIEKFLLYSDISVSNTKEATDTSSAICINENELSAFLFSKSYIYERKNDFKFEIEEGNIKISEVHFYVLFEEIIDNAIKFSPKGTDIIIRGFQADNEYILEITDYGIGISRDNLQIIAPFIQHDRMLNGQNGTGLGLPIIKSLARLYNGKFDMVSEEKKYTKVILKLPVEIKQHII